MLTRTQPVVSVDNDSTTANKNDGSRVLSPGSERLRVRDSGPALKIFCPTRTENGQTQLSHDSVQTHRTCAPRVRGGQNATFAASSTTSWAVHNAACRWWGHPLPPDLPRTQEKLTRPQPSMGFRLQLECAKNTTWVIFVGAMCLLL